jgi:exonuclease SbcC
MDPQRSHLKGFGSYIDEEVDLSNVHFAGLFGQNGSGKSSYIESLAVALFGEGPKGGKKALDNYVKTGEDGWEVEHEFLQNGNRYKVYRSWNRKKRKSTVELSLWTNGKWQPCTNKNGDAQTAINDLLRMDYKTFTSSVLALQGQTDSFTNENTTDSKRREIITQILGLDLWDRVNDFAKEKIKEINNGELKTITAEVERLTPYIDSFSVVQTQLADNQQAMDANESVLKGLESQVLVLEKDLAGFDSLVAEQGQIAKQQADLKTTLDSQIAIVNRNRQSEQEQFVKQQADLKTTFDSQVVTANRNRQSEQEQIFKQQADLKASLDSQLATVNRNRQSEQTTRATITGNINRTREALTKVEKILAHRDEVLSACKQADELTVRIAAMDELQKKHTELQSKLHEVEKTSMEWENTKSSYIASTKVEIAKDSKTAGLLNQVPCSGNEKTACPLLANANQATQNLGKLKGLLAKAEAKPNPHSATLTAVQNEIKTLSYDSEDHQNLKTKLQELQPWVRLKSEVDSGQTTKTLNEKLIQEYQETLTQIEVKLKNLNKDEIDAKTRYEESVRAFTDRRNQIEESYKKDEADAKARYEEGVKALADRRNQTEESFKKDEADAQTRYEENIKALADRLSQIEESLKKAETIRVTVIDLRSKVDTCRKNEGIYRENQGALRQSLQACLDAQTAIVEAKKRQEELEKQVRQYELIQKACNKKSGVPSLIMENATPEIQNLTNNILEEVQDGRFSVEFRTREETKTTETIQDVFKVIVYDSGADREYKTYSGAEKLIVDIAIRVAIGKFLAHRAGTEIKLLVIDEGLSALDDSNREEVVTAIREIAREFSKVLIVTHISELQDAFPQKIFFERNPVEGSRVKIVS